jgi:shikimate dehydrogenase
MTVSGAARIAGVMGWPVEHSLSPRLHGYWLECYGIDGVYVPLAVRPERLEDALRVLPALGFSGVNLTVPHKEAAATIVDVCDETARRVGAVNTVVVRPDGKIEGRNTDGYGFLQSVREAAPLWKAADGPAVLVGAGGAARAICAALQAAGAPEIRIVNRTSARAVGLAEEFGPPLIAVSWEDKSAALKDASLLVNATTLGMDGQPRLDLALDFLPRAAIVADIVYAPLKTALLRDAEARTNRAVDGIGMLLHQARSGFAAWFGREPDVTPALRAHVLNHMEIPLSQPEEP